MSSHFYRREIRELDPVEVVVVGSGPSGIAAAISAARNGASVRLIERFGFVGGNLTAGLVGPCMTSFSLDGKTQLVRGIFDEFVLRMEEAGGAVHPSKTKAKTQYSGFMDYGHEAVTPFEPEAAKLTALRMLNEAGVDLLLHSFVADTLVEGNSVRGVIVANKAGLTAVPATVVIDCSGDGDVVALGGGKFEFGRDADGAVQPVTLFFRISDVDDDAVEEYRKANPDDHFPYQSIVEEAQRNGTYNLPRRGVQLFKTLERGVWRVNTTRVLGIDGTDPTSLTRAEIVAREQVEDLIRFFRDCLPGLGECRLRDTAATIGVRESRRVRGEYELCLDDLTTGREFDDTVAVAGYPVDIHSPVDANGPFDDGIPSTANIYEIPYRSLVPETLDGVLLSGRCISATHEALAAVRVMPPSFAMGQAAGIAAAQAVELGRRPRDVDVRVLQSHLLSQGAYLGPRYETHDVASRSTEGVVS